MIGQFPPYVGGAEMQARRLAVALVKKGAEVTVLTSRIRGTVVTKPQALFDEEEGVRVHRLSAPGFGRIKMLALCFRMFREAVKIGKGVDLLHLHQGSYPAYAGIMAASVLKKPSIVKMGSAGESRFDLEILAQSFPLGLGRQMASTIVSKATRFVLLNEQVKRDLLRWGADSDRMLAIPNGVEIPERAWTMDTKTFQERVLLTKPQTLHAPVFLCVGNLLERKNHALVLEAVRILKIKGIRVILVILGEGPHRNILEKKADDWEIRDQLRFEGTVANVSDYLYAADGFVLPSMTEGMSNALLEAMALGLPCLVSDVPGNRAVVKENETGLVFALGNAEALADKMRSVLHDKNAMIRMGQAARKEMKERFAMDVVAEQYLRLYRNILP